MKNCNVKIILYDINGRMLSTIFDNFVPAGTHTLDFNAEGLASGMYIYKMVTSDYSDYKKMIVLK